MSFSIPKNIPSFDNSQRALENVYWSYSKGDGRGLPMYKDKPFDFARSPRNRPLWRRKGFLITLFLVVLVILMLFRGQRPDSLFALRRWSPSHSSTVDWTSRAESVRKAFQLSWDGYERHAWGDDLYQPLSKKGASPGSYSLGTFIVGSLDSLIVMNLTSRLVKSRNWVSESLNFAKDVNVSTFLATTQVLGGLLSAHYLAIEAPDLAPILEDDEGEPGEDLYIEKATDLADRLFNALDTSKGIPHLFINLQSRKCTAYETTAARAGGMQLEFRYISRLLGERLFWDAAEKVAATMAMAAEDGFASLNHGPSTELASLDSSLRISSDTMGYYDSLLKQFLQTSKQEAVYLELWSDVLSSVKKSLLYSKEAHFPILGTNSSQPGVQLKALMEESICQIPGLIVLRATYGRTLAQAKLATGWNQEREGEIELAKDLMKTCWAMYKASNSGIAPRGSLFATTALPSAKKTSMPPSITTDWKSLPIKGVADWRSDISTAETFQDHTQSPTIVESLFYLWRILEDETFRNLGWELWTSYVNHTSTRDGLAFVSLDDVMIVPPSQRDQMNDLWLSRTLKYFYLLFSPPGLLPLDKIVFTTAGHILPRFELQRGFKTGWTRKKKDKIQQDSDSASTKTKVDIKRVKGSGEANGGSL